ncbi:MAG: iron-sulfur cluster-binding domain-containing protein [Eubacteriales bacterium]|nr:iron-sulfur cluster-binding domain-containing protein [Eubacteriales bacterium]
MAKYNYDKNMLKGLGVGAFLGEVKLREKHIEEAEAVMPKSVFNPNIVAAKLHPAHQNGVIVKVTEYNGAKKYTIAADKEAGTEKLAYFKSGQYIAFELEIGSAYVCKPYSLCSTPSAVFADDSIYEVTVKKTQSGFASDFILDTWKVGTKVVMSGPLGHFNYETLRDSKEVIAVAGGSGITPFLSMAKAIVAGDEDFNLTILFGSRTEDVIILKDELEEAVANSNGKVKVVHVLSDEEKAGFEHGFITAELIKKYATGDYSLFVCGPKAMYKHMDGVVKELGLPKRRVRFEMSGEYGSPVNDEAYPKENADKTFEIKVWIRGESQTVTGKADQSLLQAMEAAGIHVPSDCRSGQCGWCHSRLIKGDTYIPESADGRRLADKKFGWIHPCATYPLSDIELEVFPIR